MEEIKQLKEQFEQVVKKYGLDKEERAKKIAEYLTNSTNSKITSQEFAQQFNMKEEEARIFLEFIEKGVQFKEKHIDEKSDYKKSKS